MLSAELGQPEDQFDGVDIGGDNHQLGLLVFDQSGHVVKTELQHAGTGGVVSLISGNLLFSLGQKSSLFLLLGFRGVLLQQFEQVLGLVTVDGGVELVDSWGNLD